MILALAATGVIPEAGFGERAVATVTALRLVGRMAGLT